MTAIVLTDKSAQRRRGLSILPLPTTSLISKIFKKDMLVSLLYSLDDPPLKLLEQAKDAVRGDRGDTEEGKPCKVLPPIKWGSFPAGLPGVRIPDR